VLLLSGYFQAGLPRRTDLPRGASTQGIRLYPILAGPEIWPSKLYSLYFNQAVIKTLQGAAWGVFRTQEFEVLLSVECLN